MIPEKNTTAQHITKYRKLVFGKLFHIHQGQGIFKFQQYDERERERVPDPSYSFTEEFFPALLRPLQ